MRPRLLALILASLAASGGCTVYRWQVRDRSTPEGAFETFRGAVLTKNPKEMYESLTPAFKSRIGIRDLREFLAAYRLKADEFDQVRWVLDHAKVVSAEIRETRNGLRRARIVMDVMGHRGTFELVEYPTVTVTVEIPDEEPSSADYYRSWRKSVGLRDDRVFVVVPVSAEELEVLDPSEVTGLQFHQQWLLDRIVDLPVDVDALLSQLSDTGSPRQ